MIKRMTNWGKREIYFFFLVVLVLTSCSGKSQGDYQLLICDQNDDKEYVRQDVHVGDQLEVSWIHSVELTPWIEVLEVSDDQTLILTETRFQSFGAGVPHDSEGEVQVIDGFTVMTGLERSFEQYRWIHSQEAKLTVQLNGEPLLLPEDVPHHHRVVMYLEKEVKE